MTPVMSRRCLSQSYAGQSISGECALSVTPLPFRRRLIVASRRHVSLPGEGGLECWPGLLVSPVLAGDVGRTHVTCDVVESDDLGSCGLSDVMAGQRILSVSWSRRHTAHDP